MNPVFNTVGEERGNEYGSSVKYSFGSTKTEVLYGSWASKG